VCRSWGLRYDMCYGGGFLDTNTSADSTQQLTTLQVGSKNTTVGSAVTVGNDPDNPNAFPYNDIPGGMRNASGYANAAFHAARQDPNGYPAKHCEPSWVRKTPFAMQLSYNNHLVCQDRLGTTTGKLEIEAFLAGGSDELGGEMGERGD
jgi:hypothetical protein